MEWIGWAALLVGGVVAGAINAMAGGGSLLTLPLLVFVGLPPTVANGTNRVAVAVQSLAAVASYRQAGQLPWAPTRQLLLPNLLGALAGAFVATRLSEAAFRPIVAAILLGMAALLVLRPRAIVEPAPPDRLHGALAAFLGLFAVGLYGGFIQAGVGFFYLAALVRGQGLDVVAANGVKVALIALVTLASLLVFLWAGQIDWPSGLVLSVGMGLGGWLGAKLAIRGGASLIRWVLVGTNLASAVYLLGFAGGS